MAGSSSSCQPILAFLMLFSRFASSGHSSNNWDSGNFNLDFLAWRTWFGKIPMIMRGSTLHNEPHQQQPSIEGLPDWQEWYLLFWSGPFQVFKLKCIFPSCRFLLLLYSVPFFLWFGVGGGPSPRRACKELGARLARLAWFGTSHHPGAGEPQWEKSR